MSTKGNLLEDIQYLKNPQTSLTRLSQQSGVPVEIEIEQSIDERMLQNIFVCKKRVNMCLEQNGEHFQHLL